MQKKKSCKTVNQANQTYSVAKNTFDAKYIVQKYKHRSTCDVNLTNLSSQYTYETQHHFI